MEILLYRLFEILISKFYQKKLQNEINGKNRSEIINIKMSENLHKKGNLLYGGAILLIKFVTAADSDDFPLIRWFPLPEFLPLYRTARTHREGVVSGWTMR